jgi:hypothetical protein
LNGDAPAGGHGFGKFWEMVSNELGANTDPVCEVSERGRQGWLDLKRPLQLTPNQLGIGVRVWLSPGSRTGVIDPARMTFGSSRTSASPSPGRLPTSAA